jgi:hypothetical protein
MSVDNACIREAGYRDFALVLVESKIRWNAEDRDMEEDY